MTSIDIIMAERLNLLAERISKSKTPNYVASSFDFFDNGALIP